VLLHLRKSNEMILLLGIAMSSHLDYSIPAITDVSGVAKIPS
jgi:hypothetical protein